MFGRDALAEKLVTFFQQYGINPLYACTVGCILISLSYWSDIQNGNEIEGWNKGLVVSCLFATAILCMFSFLMLIGAVELGE